MKAPVVKKKPGRAWVAKKPKPTLRQIENGNRITRIILGMDK